MCMIGTYAKTETVGIVAYRAWKLGRNGAVPCLRSTAKNFTWSRLTHADSPPGQFGSHGLWTYKLLDDVKREFPTSLGRRYVYGKVRLFGVVAEHTTGYRGEAAEILAIYCPNENRFKTVGTYRYHRGQLRRICRDTGIKLIES